MATGDVLPRYVLGVSVSPHDGAAAILRGGELLAMVEQERLSRNRYAVGESPRDAIAACLGHAGIGIADVAEVAVGWDVPALMAVEAAGELDERDFMEWVLGDLARSGTTLPPVRYVDHHEAHAASALYTSGLEEAAILVVDARGESVATTVASGGPSGIEALQTWGTEQSLGALYASAAVWAGMTIFDAGKLMGLAAYGRPDQPAPLVATTDGYEIIGAPPASSPVSTHHRRLYTELCKGFEARNFPFSRGDPTEPMAHANFAASIQRGLEEVLLNLARIARRETGYANLVMAGGVALNCTANGRLIRSGVFDEVWIPPFPHDAGVCLGAALVAERAERTGVRMPPRLPHAFWAPETGGPGAEVLAALSDCELSRHDDPELAEVVAFQLQEGRLVGWWQGRAEVGQRALGARSILCDPRQREALVRVNQVKGREAWRPLAPAVLAEHAGEVFDEPLPAPADFMLAACPVRERAQERLPAAVHVDGSARPQVVWPRQARLHAMITAFREQTGIAAVINTSFNLAGEPIVLSANDAVSTFLRSDLDVLVLDDLVAVKPGAARRVADASRRKRPGKRDGEVAISPVPWVRPSAASIDRELPTTSEQGGDPATIVQYWHSGEVPDDVAKLLASFRERNPDLHHRVFNEASAEELIREHLGPREVAAFRACAVPCMQSDYLRCCALYALGGVYADGDLECLRPIGPLLEKLEAGLLFGWPRVPAVIAPLGFSEESVFGEVERPGDYRFVNHDFFAFREPGHPLLRLAVEMMNANIESRATEDMFAATSCVFTIFYLIRELGSFDAFIDYARHGVLAPVSRLACEVIDDYDRLMEMFDGVRIAPLSERHQWVQHTFPAYKDTDVHWMRWSASIYR